MAPYCIGADHVDVKHIEGDVSLRAFIAGMASYRPRWLMMLYRLRGLLVAVLGLARHEMPAHPSVITPESLVFRPGARVAFFTVVDAEEERFWVAETPEDRHLKAFVGVIREPPEGAPARFTVFTSVFYIHWTGPVYFNIIRPFHHLVVRRTMRAAVREAG